MDASNRVSGWRHGAAHRAGICRGWLALFVLGAVAAACGGEDPARIPSTGETASAGLERGPAWQPSPSHWPAYGRDPGGSRYSPLSGITTENVAELDVAWTFRTGELGHGAEEAHDLTFQATPLHFEGRLYLSTGYDEVIALDPVTGQALWRHDPGVDRGASYSEVTSRGVAAWRDPDAEPGTPCAARIFEGTIDGRLVALDAGTGEPCEGFADGGEVALWRHAGVDPGARGDYQVTSAPAVVDGRVVVGSAIGDNWSVDTGDGSVRAFDARTGELAWEWSPLEDRVAGRVGAGNAWSTMSVDPALRLVFVPTGSASPDFYGGLRPGDNRWASSVVALDAATGDRVWGLQTVHHDLFDYDVAAQPTLVEVRREGRDVPALVQPTKTGLLFVLDRRDGTPLFDLQERPVPASDVPGEHASPTQPFPAVPAPLVDDEGVDPARPWSPDSAHAAECAEMAEGFRYEGLYTPPSLGGALLFPGNGAGTNWGSAAVDPERSLAVVPTNRFATLVRLAGRDEAEEVAHQLRAAGWEDPKPSSQRGAPYVMFRTTWVVDGVFCTPPPFREVTAVDLATGEVRWRRPLGGEGAWTSGVGGPVVTAGGLVFLAGAADREIRALDVGTGEVLWSAELPRAALATPMTYRGADGRQYVVVAAGGHGKWGLETGDFLVAFAVPPSG
jgi:quinoprotein glucose dehydrogenase